MDRQDELLEREDGRYFAIDKIGTGIGSIAKSESLTGSVVSFGLPSGPALFLHLARTSYGAIKSVDPRALFDAHPHGIWPDRQGPLFDFFEAFIVHVVFAHTAIEAFANEVIPEDFKFATERKGVSVVFGREEIGRRMSLDEKLDAVLPSILHVNSPKGSALWERYQALKAVRDRIIHLKAVDRRASGPEQVSVWGVMLNESTTPFCDNAHALIGHYVLPGTRRWFQKYPYGL